LVTQTGVDVDVDVDVGVGVDGFRNFGREVCFERRLAAYRLPYLTLLIVKIRPRESYVVSHPRGLFIAIFGLLNSN
jgi:hypothetical protein